MTRELPTRWRASVPALRAVQVAFDVSEQVLRAIRLAAFESERSNSDQVRVLLGLPVTRQPQRPRLTISLSPGDYQLLGKRYKLPSDDHLAIKERVNAELIAFAEQAKTPRRSAQR